MYAHTDIVHALLTNVSSMVIHNSIYIDNRRMVMVVVVLLVINMRYSHNHTVNICIVYVYIDTPLIIVGMVVVAVDVICIDILRCEYDT